MIMSTGSIQDRIGLAYEMIGRNNDIEMELIEQLALIALQPPIYRQPPAAQHRASTQSLFAVNSNRLPQQNLPKAVVEYIAGKSDGVPLYIEELIKATTWPARRGRQQGSRLGVGD
jgi:hypothetical protein